MFPEPRRRKRRGKWYALLVVTLLLAVSVGFTNLRSDRADLREFVDLAERAALEQEALAAEFTSFMNFEIQAAERDRITTLFDSIRTTTTDQLNELAVLEVPAEGANAEALFSEALEAWLAGSEALELGLLAAADEPASPIPVIAIDNALIEIRVGDRLYERFLLSLDELLPSLETEVGEVPVVAYAPSDGLILTGEVLANAVRGSEEVAAFHDVRIGQMSLEPGFTGGDHDGVGVLAFTESVTLTVVISNTGNLLETELTVAVRVTTLSDGLAVFSEQTTIVSLEAGASKTVEFPGIPVVEGITHEVLAIVNTSAEDVDTDNNTATLPFFVQAAS